MRITREQARCDDCGNTRVCSVISPTRFAVGVLLCAKCLDKILQYGRIWSSPSPEEKTERTSDMWFVIRDPKSLRSDGGHAPSVTHDTINSAAAAAVALAAKNPGTRFLVVQAVGEACTVQASYHPLVALGALTK